MTGAVLFLGDLLVPQPTRKPAQPEPARTILWTSDLRDTTGGRATRLALKAAAHAAFEVCRTRPGIRHLVLAYRADSAVIPALHRRAPAVAIRLHAEIEQQAGRDVDVVLLDISDLDDPGLLHERLEELSRQPAGLAGAAALDWREIREESIRHAANSDYI
ncbi:hypothetical protein [Microbacterium dextranolyticum]|uniref:Uncharacterized protein n=1 Tax=Microbacterium dextranolyticum TaxID=36806 RepID=A0A9W6HND9_9MICO|nr:hypothetical protein [Microbacterium dextranolyticum]MBM7462524.1 hypothetical protein [Microbacterium dextranolyticum]GLJ96382.1 hypothetical protein GCM10017591_24450 [Microbacterium dextranolyticum]